MVAWSEVKELIGELYEPETRTKHVADTITYLGAEKVISAKGVETVASLATVAGLQSKKDEVKELIGELYELEKRPKLVADYATALGAERYLSTEKIEELAALSTVDGLKGKTAELKELAAPYVAKVYVAEGRKELVTEATDLATEKVIKPVREYTVEKVEAVKAASKEYASEKVLKPASEKVVAAKELASEKVTAVKEIASEKVIKPTKELAEPYIAKSNEIAAPYIAKIESKRAEIVASKRYEKAIAALQQAREHPLDLATDLKSKAIDLLKYDNLASYRDYVQSDEFTADTMRLVKVELPAIASDAATRGVDKVKQGALSLATEIEAKRGQILLALERGYSTARNVELAALQDKVKSLAAEIKGELASGVEHVKSEGFSLSDALERMKRVVGAIDAILITPLITTDAAATEAPTEVAGDAVNIPSSGSVPLNLNAAEAAEEGEEDTFDDAEEQPTEEMKVDEPN